jgi:hypothetical protein
MRRARLILLTLLAAVLAGCGGNEITADEVPVSPPTITIPESRDAGPDSAARNNADENADADATATATPDDSSAATGGTASGEVAGGTTDTGTAGTEDTGGATDQTQTQEQAPPETGGAGATDEGLDQFCADNPGAC